MNESQKRFAVFDESLDQAYYIVFEIVVCNELIQPRFKIRGKPVVLDRVKILAFCSEFRSIVEQTFHTFSEFLPFQ